MEIIRVKDFSPDDNFLGSRFNGKKIRERMEKSLFQEEVVTLDFKDIEMITQSFGDEIVGIFVREFGVEFVKKHIKIVDANHKIKSVLNLIVEYSKEMMETS